MERARKAYPDDPIMAGAWASALHWAAQEPEVLKKFKEETNVSPVFAEKRSALDREIDKVTGNENASVEAFVDWFNENVWGENPFSQGGE